MVQTQKMMQDVFYLLSAVFSLCGLLGNGVVIWLLGFCIKRNPFSVYILNLSWADTFFLLANSIWFTFYLLRYHIDVFLETVTITSYLLGLSLLMTVSTECCFSVLCPGWYTCHRPEHLSTVLCALIWALACSLGVVSLLCSFFEHGLCYVVEWTYIITYSLTFLILCVSSLILHIRVHCCSWRGLATRLYMTILLNVLAFLLLGLPYGLCSVVYFSSSLFDHDLILTDVLYILVVLSCGLKPIIYFFVGRHRQPDSRRPLREALQSALTDEKEEAEQRRVPIPHVPNNTSSVF